MVFIQIVPLSSMVTCEFVTMIRNTIRNVIFEMCISLCIYHNNIMFKDAFKKQIYFFIKQRLKG